MEAKCRQNLLGTGKPATFPVSGLCFSLLRCSLFADPFFLLSCVHGWMWLLSSSWVFTCPSVQSTERFTHLVLILNSWERESERHNLHQMTNLDFPKIASNLRALCGVYCTPGLVLHCYILYYEVILKIYIFSLDCIVCVKECDTFSGILGLLQKCWRQALWGIKWV